MTDEMKYEKKEIIILWGLKAFRDGIQGNRFAISNLIDQRPKTSMFARGDG